jgi:twitching motility two-component system response regulator PilG
MGRIMVVDDDPDLLRLLEKILMRRGYEVATSSSGGECLERVKIKRPDLILLDVMMPDMDGWTVCKALKADPDTRNIPVVILTVMTSEESIEGGFKFAGCDAHLEKPIRREELFGTIEGLLGSNEMSTTHS